MTPKEKQIIQSSTARDSDGDFSVVDSSPARNFFFLSDEAVANLPKFQYRGQDLSLWYTYVSSPLAAFCVNRIVPEWVAPNTITLFGWCLILTSYVSFWFYVPTLQYPAREDGADESVPRWIFLWNGITMFLYQTLDNMDGKQARKTKSSSPLGLMFDHGIDAANSICGSANWMIAMMLDPVRDVALCFSILFGPYGLFYFSTWEEYYTGELIMPIINGPNEGLTGGAIMSFLSFWYGPQIWQRTTVWEQHLLPFLRSILPSDVSGDLLDGVSMRHADLLVLAASVGFVQEMVLKGTFVIRKYGVRTTLSSLAPFLVLVGCALVIGYTDLDIWLSMPRTSLHLCAALFVEMTTALMLAHVTDTNFRSDHRLWLLSPLMALSVGVAVLGVRSSRQTDDFLLLYASAAIGFLSLKFAVVIHEVCTVLGIWCFDITRPRLKNGGLQRNKKIN